RHFWGGPARQIRAVLRAFPAARTVEFFDGLGVALHEEEDGKLFPDSNRARTVLDALLRECEIHGIDLRTEHRVVSIEHVADAFRVVTNRGALHTTEIVL